jgi:hypothetical protein
MGYHTPIPPPRWLQRHIRNTLKYYPKSGKLIWVNPIANRLKPGDSAGSLVGRGYLTGKGYLRIKFTKNNQTINVLVHHICWFLYYGEWPPRQLDHRNTNSLDNRIKNLRLASSKQNGQNKGLRKDNTSGITGVRWRFGKWWARIYYKHKLIEHSFPDFKSAVQARRKAEKKYFGRWRYSG